MHFQLTTISNGQFREFTLTTSSLEEGLEAITRIGLACEQLLRVRLTEGASIIDLPTQVFDGQPIHHFINQLEQQWQAALHRPATAPRSNQSLMKPWYSQQIDLLQKTITSLHRLIEVANFNCHWLETALLTETARSGFLSQNARTRIHFQRALSIAQEQLERYTLLIG